MPFSESTEFDSQSYDPTFLQTRTKRTSSSRDLLDSSRRKKRVVSSHFESSHPLCFLSLYDQHLLPSSFDHVALPLLPPSTNHRGFYSFSSLQVLRFYYSRSFLGFPSSFFLRLPSRRSFNHSSDGSLPPLSRGSLYGRDYSTRYSRSTLQNSMQTSRFLGWQAREVARG